LLSLSLLAAIYFPLGFYFFSDKTLKQQVVPFSIIGGILLSIAVTGVLFKLLFWPGAMISLFVSFATLPFLVALCIWFHTSGKREEFKVYYRNFLIRSVFWFVVASAAFALSAEQLVRVQHRDDPRYIHLRLMTFEHPDEESFRNDLNAYEDSVYMVRAREN
jgi:predicted membrane channel-forming protein YqfA (hemolysin III family)